MRPPNLKIVNSQASNQWGWSWLSKNIWRTVDGTFFWQFRRIWYHTRLSWYCLEHGIGWWAIPDAVAKVSQRTLFYWHRCESQLKNILLLLWNISVAFSNKIFPRLKSLFLRIFQTTIFDLFPILSGINTYRYRRKIHDTSKAFILHTSLLQ